MLAIRSLLSPALAITLLAGSVAVTACGGGAGGEEPQSPNAKASAEVSAIDELKAIPKDLDAELANLTKPIDDVQSIIDDVTSLPKKYGINAADAMRMAKATIETGKIEVKAKGNLSAEAKAEIESVLTRLKEVVEGLKATPDKAVALGAKMVATTAKVPVLATKATSAASFTAVSPFGSAESKAKAKADIESVKQIQADVSKSVNDVQAKITGIPALATTALAKLTKAFGGG
jgi:hypothetical protein